MLSLVARLPRGILPGALPTHCGRAASRATCLAVLGLVVAACNGDQPATSAQSQNQPTAIVAPQPYMYCMTMVFFDPGSSALSLLALSVLDRFGQTCPEAYGRTLVVRGHTDFNGSQESNIAISRARADAVRTYLLSTGVPAKSIEVEALGDTKPLVGRRADRLGANENQDKQNRRVEVTVK